MMAMAERIGKITGRDLGRDFERFWIGSTSALFGSAFGLVVLPLVATLALGAAAGEVGLLAFVETAPYLLFGLFVGAIVDRVSRRLLMVTTHLLRAVLLAFVPVLHLLGLLALPVLYVIAFLVGTLSLLFEVAHQSYLPALVSREQLVQANGRMQFSRSAAELSGPSIGGAAVQLLTAPVAVVVNATAFVIAGVVLLTVRRRDELPAPAGKLWSQVRDGITFVLRNPILRGIAAALTSLYFFITAVAPLIIVLAARDLRLAPAAIGVALAFAGVGTLIAAAVSAGLTRRFGVNGVLVLGAVSAGLGPAAAAIATPVTALPLLILSELLTSFGATLFAVAQVSVRQVVTPDEMLGRMNGTLRFMGFGGRALGLLIASILAGVVGTRATVAIGAVGGLVALIAVLGSPLARLRSVADAAPFVATADPEATASKAVSR